MTAVLTGLIWTIQWVHYPSFHFVDKTEFSQFTEFHAQRISHVVIPLMLSELAAAIWLPIITPQIHSLLAYLSLALLISIWVITFMISAPTHGRLGSGYQENLVDHLIRTNWLRTFLWTARLLLVSYLLVRAV